MDPYDRLLGAVQQRDSGEIAVCTEAKKMDARDVRIELSDAVIDISASAAG